MSEMHELKYVWVWVPQKGPKTGIFALISDAKARGGNINE